MTKKTPRSINRKQKYVIIGVLFVALVVLLTVGYMTHRNEQPKQLNGPLHPIVGCQRLQDGQVVCM